MSKRTQTSHAEQLRVGDKVLVQMWNGQRRAEIVEDRGPIGIDGRRVFRVRFPGHEEDDTPTFEVPSDQVSIINGANAR